MRKYLHGLGLMVMWSTDPDWVISESALRLCEERLGERHSVLGYISCNGRGTA